MGTEKRARQKANRQARLAEVEAEAAKETREQSTRRLGRIAAVVAGIIGLIVLISVLRGGDDERVAPIFESDEQTQQAEPPTAVPEITLATSVPDDFEPWQGTGALGLVEPQARNGAYDEMPPMMIDPEGVYSAVLNTSVGPIRLNLFADKAPITVNNFVALARDGFYDGLTFHRVIDGFMAQGGDPIGTGTGGPGYSFVDEFDPELSFVERGLLAMANSGEDTNGSQFFITTTDDPRTGLDGVHTIFGAISDDAPALDEIPVTGDGDPVVIESVRIIEG